MLADGDLDIGFGSNAKQSLANGYRLLGCIEPDFEYLLRTLELTDQFLELTLLLLTLSGSGAQFSGPLASLVHQRGVGLPNCDHIVSLS